MVWLVIRLVGREKRGCIIDLNVKTFPATRSGGLDGFANLTTNAILTAYGANLTCVGVFSQATRVQISQIVYNSSRRRMDLEQTAESTGESLPGASNNHARRDGAFWISKPADSVADVATLDPGKEEGSGTVIGGGNSRRRLADNGTVSPADCFKLASLLNVPLGLVSDFVSRPLRWCDFPFLVLI